jgi:hypothetical protein
MKRSSRSADLLPAPRSTSDPAHRGIVTALRRIGRRCSDKIRHFGGKLKIDHSAIRWQPFQNRQFAGHKSSIAVSSKSCVLAICKCRSFLLTTMARTPTHIRQISCEYDKEKLVQSRRGTSLSNGKPRALTGDEIKRASVSSFFPAPCLCGPRLSLGSMQNAICWRGDYQKCLQTLRRHNVSS